MPTHCISAELGFGSSGGRKLVGAFDGGAITSNGGAVLLAAADRRIGLSSRLAACFRDLRDGARGRATPHAACLPTYPWSCHRIWCANASMASRSATKI